MHGLPADFDAGVFTGRTLEALTAGSNVISLSFGVGLSVTLEGSFDLAIDGTSSVRFRVPDGLAELSTFLDHAIVEGRVLRERDLQLAFDNDQTLICLDDTTLYESYHVTADGREIHI